MRKRSLKLFCGNDGVRLCNYQKKPLVPQTGSPVILIGKEFSSRQKLQLVFKMHPGSGDFVVKNGQGKPFFVLQRKSVKNWGRRVLRTGNGEAVCAIEKNTEGEGFRIYSLASPKQELVMEVTDMSKPGQNMWMVFSKKPSGMQICLKIEGEFDKGLFGISRHENGKEGSMVAMTWEIAGNNSSSRKDKVSYLLEVPAGVDAAAMAALAVAINERNNRGPDTTDLPIESQMDSPFVVFGKKFLTSLEMPLVLSVSEDRVGVVDPFDNIKLICTEKAMFKDPDGIQVFKVTKGLAIRGVDSLQKEVEILFRKFEGIGSMEGQSGRIIFDVFVERKKREVLAVSILPGDPLIALHRVDFGMFEKSPIPGPVIARAMLGNGNMHQFERWYHEVLSRLAISTPPDAKPIVHLGVGVEVAEGVDVALVFATVLTAIKMMPAYMNCKATVGTIRPVNLDLESEDSSEPVDVEVEVESLDFVAKHQSQSRVDFFLDL